MGAANAANPHVAALPHKAYIAYLGYPELNRRIPSNAIVQFNPEDNWLFWKNVDLANINRQAAIVGGPPSCGSNLGGNPSACPTAFESIVPLFHGRTAAQALAVCRAWHIDYLVVIVQDSAWHDPNSWVWTLKPVLANPEFRALDCH